MKIIATDNTVLLVNFNKAADTNGEARRASRAISELNLGVKVVLTSYADEPVGISAPSAEMAKLVQQALK